MRVCNADMGTIYLRRMAYCADRLCGDTMVDGSLLRALVGFSYFTEQEYDKVLAAVSEHGFDLSIKE